MKTIKILYAIILLSVMSCSLNKAYCQASSAGNGNFPVALTDYAGWNGNTTIPLQIRHNGHYRINFYTDSTFRLVIDTTYGRVGIGRFFETNPVAYLLDVDSDINIGRAGVTDNQSFGKLTTDVMSVSRPSANS